MKDSVVDHNMSNLTSASGEVSASPTSFLQEQTFASAANQAQPPLKKKRGLPGNPDPDAEVIALSPKTLLTTHRFICEICSKGFQRDQNLQLHRRGHNLPWKLKRKTNKEIVRKKVYVCPEPSCPHHDSSRALGDLTGIKKHFSRKHGEKKWKCEKCSKRYAVQSDWKAHSKICGTREYGCDCGTIFSRRDSFITHRAFCDALLKETTRRAEPIITVPNSLPTQQITPTNFQSQYFPNPFSSFSVKSEVQLQEQNGHNVPQWLGPPCPNPTNLDPSSAAAATALDHHDSQNPSSITPTTLSPFQNPTADLSSSSSHMSATALLQKASQMGATAIQTQKKSGTSDLSSNQHIDSYKAASSISQSPFLLPEMGIRPCFVGGSSSPSSSSLQLGFSRTVGSQFSDGGGGFTRDFLGIDEFGPREFTEMPGFEHISSSSSSTSSRFDLQWHGLN